VLSVQLIIITAEMCRNLSFVYEIRKGLGKIDGELIILLVFKVYIGNQIITLQTNYDISNANLTPPMGCSCIPRDFM